VFVLCEGQGKGKFIAGRWSERVELATAFFPLPLFIGQLLIFIACARCYHAETKVSRWDPTGILLIVYFVFLVQILVIKIYNKKEKCTTGEI
jgi:hypothetical protein